MNWMIVVISIVLAASASCGIAESPNSQGSTQTAIIQTTATPFSTPISKPSTEVDLIINGILAGDREATVLARLGKPSKTENGKEVDACANGYHRYLKYEGLTIDLLSDEHRRNYSVTHIEVTSPKWEIEPGVHIGDTIEKIREIYGDPVSESSEGLAYVTREGGPEGWVDFDFKNGKLVRAEMTETLC